jgi:hypothetical protein
MENEANSLIGIVRKQPDIDTKLEVLTKIISTQTTATLNVLLGLISVVERTPGVDKAGLVRELLEVKESGGGDEVDPKLYDQFIDLCLWRADPSRGPKSL